MSTLEFLQGQLERLFELDGMMALSSELLGVEPSELGVTDAKDAFARALVRHCESHDGLVVLAEALRVSAGNEDEELAALPDSIDEELQPGAEVRSFRVLRLLEQGPLATVYLAERPAPDNGHTERVQLSVFRREATRDRVAVWRMLTAARVLKDVRSTGLVAIYEAGTLPDGRAFVACEATEGESLAARLAQSGPLTLDELWPIARTFLEGLAALHERNLLHGYLSTRHLLIVRPFAEDEEEQDVELVELVEDDESEGAGDEAATSAEAAVDFVLAQNDVEAHDFTLEQDEVEALASALDQHDVQAHDFAPEQGEVEAPAGALDQNEVQARDFAPERNVVEARDFAPERNVLDVQPYGALTELATARLLENHEDGIFGVLRIVGDPATLAPEVARGETPTARSEIYAAGCLLYQALTGVPVFEAATSIDVVSAHLYEEAALPSERAPQAGISPGLDELLMRTLSKDPRQRPQSARELVQALEMVAHGNAPPPPLLSQVELVRALTALQEGPGDPARAADLEAVVAPSGDWREAIDAFADTARDVEDIAIKKQLLFRCARIHADELSDLEAAEQSYRAVLELDPSDAQAHTALEELHRESANYEALIGLLLDRLEKETSAEARASILREVATLYEEQLAQPESGLVAWAQALAENAADDRARRAVERLAAEPAQREEVIGILRDGLADASDRPAHALSLSVLIAGWLASDGHADLALPYLKDALRIDPAHEPALEALTELYQGAGAWDELAQLLSQRADAAPNPAKKLDYKARAAEIAYGKLGNVELAERTYAEVVADDPAHPAAVAALEEIYVDAGNLPKLFGLLENKAKELRGTARAQALCELAELYEDDPETQKRALEHYQSAAAADDRYLPAYQGQARMYTAHGAHAELLEALERQRDLVTTPQQRTHLLEQLASVYEHGVSDVARTVEAYEQIIEIAPAHEVANTALARLYRQLHRFEELAQTLDRHAKGAEEPTRKVELLMEAARVLMADLGSPERAAFVCERVLAVTPDHPDALALTARIRAMTGDTVAALDALELLADTEQDPQRKADLWVRAGLMLEGNDDLDNALERYRLSLDAVADYAPAFEALSRIYGRRGDVHGEAELLQRQVELARTPEERAARLVALGKLRLEKLKDKTLAADAYQRAYELAPNSREALLGLGLLALADQQWEDAVTMLEPLLETTAELPSELARQLCMGAGDAYHALDRRIEAEQAYLRVRAMAGYQRDINERLAELMLLEERYEEACELLGEILDKAGSSLPLAERSALLMKLGQVRRKLGELERAAAAFSAASEILPEANEPLVALAEVQEEQGHTEAVARTLQRRLELEQDSEARFALLVRVGDLFAQLRDRKQAARFYVAALELNADDRNLLSKLMAVYSEGKNWARLVDVLVRMAHVVDDPRLSGKYLYTAARIAQKELNNYDDAIDYYESAVGFDPTLESAFQALIECLTREGAWERLATAYRAQIERVRHALDHEQLAALWERLGTIYIEKLRRIDAAVEAYEQAAELEPENRKRLELLVDLYGLQPSRFGDRAITAHERLLAQNPYRVESHRALRKLYTQLSRPDEAWVVCQVLRSLNMAEPEEETFFKRHRVQAPATARECIGEELWQEHLLLPEQDESLTTMLALIQPAAVQALAQPPEAFGLGRERPIDCQRDGSLMAQMLHYAAGVMLVPLPAVYFRQRDPGGISMVFMSPPALALGQGTLRNAPDQALAFIAARQLSYFRPGHYMRHLVPTGRGLRGWILAAIRLANPRFPVPEPLREEVEHNHAALAKTLHQPQRQALGSLVEQLLRDQPELDVKRWALAVDMVADRAGFVLANSLEAAVALVRASPKDSSHASERDRLKALYQYAVSPKYLALRKAIGVKIQ